MGTQRPPRRCRRRSLLPPSLQVPTRPRRLCRGAATLTRSQIWKNLLHAKKLVRNKRGAGTAMLAARSCRTAATSARRRSPSQAPAPAGRGRSRRPCQPWHGCTRSGLPSGSVTRWRWHWRQWRRPLGASAATSCSTFCRSASGVRSSTTASRLSRQCSPLHPRYFIKHSIHHLSRACASIDHVFCFCHGRKIRHPY
jgi:hypothetical protein